MDNFCMGESQYYYIEDVPCTKNSITHYNSIWDNLYTRERNKERIYKDLHPPDQVFFNACE